MIAAAMMLDRLMPHLQRPLHPLDRWRPWFRELRAYHRHLTWPEFWARYAMGRVRARDGEQWLSMGGAACLERNVRDYYASHEYFLYRQAYYHRDRTWAAVLATMPRSGGSFVEYGCGIAPASAWLCGRVSGWTWTLVDLPSPAFSFAVWRLTRRLGQSPAVFPVSASGDPALPSDARYTTIVCSEVLEHVVNPVAVVAHLVEHLAPGGRLFVDFVQCEPSGLNLAEAQARRGEALAVLDRLICERPVTPAGPLGLYRRRGD